MYFSSASSPSSPKDYTLAFYLSCYGNFVPNHLLSTLVSHQPEFNPSQIQTLFLVKNLHKLPNCNNFSLTIQLQLTPKLVTLTAIPFAIPLTVESSQNSFSQTLNQPRRRQPQRQTRKWPRKPRRTSSAAAKKAGPKGYLQRTPRHWARTSFGAAGRIKMRYSPELTARISTTVTTPSRSPTSANQPKPTGSSHQRPPPMRRKLRGPRRVRESELVQRSLQLPKPPSQR